MEQRSGLNRDFIKILARYENDYLALKNKRIMITGVCGMIAEYLLHFLMFLNQECGSNIQVVGICLPHEDADSRYADYTKQGWFRCVKADVQTFQTEDCAVDVIIHAASPTSPYLYEHFPADVAAINVIGTWNMLNQAKKAGATLLLLSSSSIYGVPEKKEVSEQDFGPLDPLEIRSCYSEGKRAAEMLCAAFSYQHGIETRIVRCRRVYGPTANLGAQNMLNMLICATARCETIDMYRDPENMIQLLYVGDAVSGILKVLLKGENAQAYNICSDDPISMDVLAERLTNLSSAWRLNIRWQSRDQVTDIVRTRKQQYRNNAKCVNDKLCALDWEPLFSLEDGMLSTVEAFGKEIRAHA